MVDQDPNTIELTVKTIIYGIAWTILGAVSLVILTQLIIYFRERLTKGSDLGTALILKEMEILRLESGKWQDLVKKDLESITKALIKYEAHMERTDKAQSESEKQISDLKRTLEDAVKRVENNEKLIFGLEKDFLNAGIKLVK